MNKLFHDKRTAIVVVLVGLALIAALLYVFFGRGIAVQNSGPGGEPVDPSKAEIEDGYNDLKNNPPNEQAGDVKRIEHYELLRYSASRLGDCRTIEVAQTEMQKFAPKEKVITTQLWAASCYLQDGAQKDVAKAEKLFDSAETEIDSIPAGEIRENLTTQLNLRRPV